MNREQLIEFCAVALWAGWREEENQRRREIRALMPPGRGLTTVVSGPPYDLPEWGGIQEGQREAFRARARTMVLALERECLLKVGSERAYDVEIDDPDLARPYRYAGIPAFSAQAAAWEAARRAVRADPLKFLYRAGTRPESGMPFPTGMGFPPPWDDRITIESPTLIEAVAIYARVRLAQSGEAWVEGDALWLEYAI